MEENRPDSIPEAPESYFDGTTLQLIGWRLLAGLLSVVTLGLGAAWAECMVLRWETKHTLVEGRRLHFDGRGHQLLGRWLLWGLLTVITLGIYAIFLPVKMHKWRVSHTRFATALENAQHKPTSGWAVVGGILAGMLLLGLLGCGIYAAAAYLEPVRLWPLPALPQQTEAPEATQPTQPAQPQSPATEPTTAEGVWLPSADDDGDYWYVHNPKEGLNLRYGPGTEYDVICNLPHGTEILVLDWQNGWAFTGDGWCAGNYLDINPPKDTGSKEESKDIAAGIQGSAPRDKRIVGTWLFVSDHSDSRFENLIFEFRSNGVFVARCRQMSRDYDGTFYHDSGDIPHWDVICRPTWSGTYTYDGAKLKLYYRREYTYSTDGPTSDPNTKNVGFWHQVDETVTLDVTAAGDTMYIADPQDIRYYPFSVPLDFGSRAEHYFWPLPDGADTAYDYRQEMTEIFG